MKRYFRIWLKLTLTGAKIAYSSRVGISTFLIAKIIRLSFFAFFLVILTSHTKKIVGYDLWQVLFFYLTFNLVDISAQFLLRDVYRFRSYVLKGLFDYTLIRPFPPLLRSLFGGADMGDLPVLILSVIALVFLSLKLPDITIFGVFVYILLIVNSFIIALSFHIFVLAIGVLTTEVENTLLVYRDLTQMGRVPVDIYKQPVRLLVTFVVPVGIMMTFPAKAIMGLLSFQMLAVAFIVSGTLFFASFFFWKFSLKKYSSASS